MSRPGFWMHEGREIRIQDMADSHFRNSLRYMCRKRLENLELTSDGPAVARSKRERRNYYEMKIVELGNEAQRRNIIPQGTLTITQLSDIATGWPTARDARPSIFPAIDVLAGARPARESPPVQVADVMAAFESTFNRVPATPVPQLSSTLNAISEVEAVIGIKVFGMTDDSEQASRRIQMEL